MMDFNERQKRLMNKKPAFSQGEWRVCGHPWTSCYLFLAERRGIPKKIAKASVHAGFSPVCSAVVDGNVYGQDSIVRIMTVPYISRKDTDSLIFRFSTFGIPPSAEALNTSPNGATLIEPAIMNSYKIT